MCILRGRTDKDITVNGRSKKKKNYKPPRSLWCHYALLSSCYFILIRFVRVWTALFMWLDKFAFLADSCCQPPQMTFSVTRARNHIAHIPIISTSRLSTALTLSRPPPPSIKLLMEKLINYSCLSFIWAFRWRLQYT